MDNSSHLGVPPFETARKISAPSSSKSGKKSSVQMKLFADYFTKSDGTNFVQLYRLTFLTRSFATPSSVAIDLQKETTIPCKWRVCSLNFIMNRISIHMSQFKRPD